MATFNFTPMGEQAKQVARSTQDFYPIYDLKNGDTMKGWFVTEFRQTTGLTDFLGYSEVGAFDGLKDGRALPVGLKWIPVDPELGPNDPVISLLNRSRYDIAENKETGETFETPPQVKSKALFNFVNDEGKHILVKVTGAKGRDLAASLSALRTNLDGKYQIRIIKDASHGKLVITPLDDETIDLPAAFDCSKVINDIRIKADNFVNQEDTTNDVFAEVEEQNVDLESASVEKILSASAPRLRTKMVDLSESLGFDREEMRKTVTAMKVDELREYAIEVGLQL
jgi:hypothetical protein